jgi:TRAP-type C4-dicarboxylate transport system permease small subunit
MLRLLSLLPEGVGIALMAALAVLLFLQVLLRYFFNAPLAWSDDIIRIMFVWVSLLGAAIAWKRRAHLHIAIIGERLPHRWRRLLPLLASVVAAAVSAALMVQGWIGTQQNMRQLLPITGIPVGWLYLALPVSAALILLYSLQHLREDLVNLRCGAKARTTHAESPE